MKILIVGDFSYNIYEQAFFDSFSDLGEDVFKFSWSGYFKEFQKKGVSLNFLIFKTLFYKLQYKFSFGPTIRKINNDLICFTKKEKPDLVFIYRGIFIYPGTIKEIKRGGSFVFGYNNDDPFSKKYPFYFWRHFLKGIKFYDYLFAYRIKNIDDYKKIGYNNVSLLRSYYIKNSNIFNNKKNNDVVFVGHFEDDKRDEYLKFLFENGIDIKIFGDSSWKKSNHFSFFKEKGILFNAVYSPDYEKTLNSSKICLVFLSKMNNDTYTRRCFEIPAARSMMLSEYSDDICSLFLPQKEFDYFKSKEDLLNKVRFYLDNEEKRESMILACCDRLVSDGHEVSDRVKYILDIYNLLKNK